MLKKIITKKTPVKKTITKKVVAKKTKKEKERESEGKSDVTSNLASGVRSGATHSATSNITRLVRINFFDSIAKYAVYVLIVLLPIFFIPTSLVDISQAKIGLLVLAVTISVISLGISAIYRGSLQVIDKKILIPVILISAITFLSSIWSTSYKGGFLGLGTEVDSWYLISILLLVTIVVSSVINKRERIFSAFSLFWMSFGLASLFQIIRLLTSSIGWQSASNFFSLGVFSLPAQTTIGTWADFGLMAGVVSLSLAITLDMVPLKSSIKNTFWFLFGVSALMATLASSILIGSGLDQLNNGSNFVIPSITIVGIMAFIFALFQLRNKRKEKQEKGDEGSKNQKTEYTKFPKASFVLICLGVIFMISPLAINQKINSSFNIPNESVLNVRPGFSDTLEVTKGALSSSIKNSLLGVGPHGFYIAWNQYRPNYINSLDSWNIDFQFGTGYLPTILIGNGIIAFIIWVFSLLALFFIGLKTIFDHKRNESSSVYAGVVTFVSALFLWINMLINISGQTVIILTFIVTGLMIANLCIDKKFQETEICFNKDSNKDKTKNNIAVLAVIIFIILVVCLAFIWVQRTRSEFYSSKSMSLIYSKDASIAIVPKAISLLKKSYEIYPSDVYARGINNLDLVQINYDVSMNPNIRDFKAGEQLAMNSGTVESLKEAVFYSKASVDENRNDFRNFLQLGSTMQTVALLTSDEQAGKLSMQSLLQAMNLAPNHPLPPYTLANLYILAGDKNSAKILLAQALKLKPNFKEATETYQRLLIDDSLSITNASTSSATSTTKSTASSTIKSKVNSTAKTSTSTKSTSKIVKPVIKKK